MSNNRNFRDEEFEQQEEGNKGRTAEEELTEEDVSFDDLINPKFDEKLGRCREYDDDETDDKENNSREEDSETDYLITLQKDTKLKELNDIKITDGDYDEEIKLLQAEEEKEDDSTEEEKYEKISEQCFTGDDEQTKGIKNKAIQKFLNSSKYEIVCNLIKRSS